VTLAYAVALVAVAVTLPALGPHAQATAVADMSTNLHNLGRGHLDTLVGSAFVTDDDKIYVWLPGLMCLLAAGELAWRSGRLVLAFALGHIGATLLVAVGLTVAVGVRWLPFSIADASDVGVSYGAAAVLGALTAVIPVGWRPAWIGWWLGSAVIVASTGDFTAVGHALAITLGIGLSALLRSPASWTATRALLLTAGVAGGYLLLNGSSLLTASAGGVAGVVISLIAQRITRWRRAIPAQHGTAGGWPDSDIPATSQYAGSAS
jgi:hypothetical protein